MDEWYCAIAGRPVSKGNHRKIVINRCTGKPFLIGSPAARKAEKAFRDYVRDCAPREPFNGPIVVDLEFVFKIPKARAKQLRPGDPKEERPDRGNLAKLAEDALEGLVYVDDAQIVDGFIRKVWGERDETRVWVRPYVDRQASQP